MTADNLRKMVADLPDAEAERCLQVLVKGYAERHNAQELFHSETLLLDVVGQYSDLIVYHKQKEFPKPSEESRPTAAPPEPRTSQPPNPRPEVKNLDERPQVVRKILTIMADDDDLRPRLASWFESDRPTLVDPITAALTLAGIVLVLSTDIEIDFGKDRAGKTHFRARLKKDPTKAGLLGRFFSFFGGVATDDPGTIDTLKTKKDIKKAGDGDDEQMMNASI